MNDFEELLERQLQLDLYSDMELKDKTDAANYNEMVDYIDTIITGGIIDCIHKMNRRKY